MNWGYKIMLVYIVFVAGILLLVFKSSSQKVDLVTENYYQQELKYEQKIDEAERAQSLSSPLKYEVNNNALTVYFPEEMNGVKLKAQALIYYAADEAKDKNYNLETGNGKMVIDLPASDKGMYELKMDWTADNIKYYSEHKFFIK
ncbi:MAG: FixH family protein [Bacteroidota bacterium]|nr:FixH family protein [Bacteroidota bacterium]